MEILSQVAEGMQGVLTEAADIIGRKTGFIKRLRKLSGTGISCFRSAIATVTEMLN